MFYNDVFFMQQALAQAKKAEQIGEIPVGCVITKDEEIISYGYNLRETKNNALYHAEIIAIDNACKTINSWRLEGCTIYVTLEPCPMCMGAIINARISTVVFGSWDKKGGCCGGLIHLGEYGFNHRPTIRYGVLEEECTDILKKFFQKIR